MRTELDCLKCIFTQAIEAPKAFTKSAEQRERIVREAAEAIATFDLRRAPPELGGMLNDIMSRVIGVYDLYQQEKRRFNHVALDMLSALREKASASANPFETALRLAIAGNIIDFGIPGGFTDEQLRTTIENSLVHDLHAPPGFYGADTLARKALEAQRVLYVADNVGEVVLDRLLIEQIGPEKVTVVVRSGPAINDVTLEDAHEAGIADLAKIIVSGVALPGTPLDRCSDELREHFESSDLVISKGQGNYETLSDWEGPIAYLLVAKCSVVAHQLGCAIGDFVVACRAN